MDKYQLKLLIGDLIKFKWGFVIIVAILFMFAIGIYWVSGPKVEASCTLISKGATMTKTGNSPYGICKLANGKTITVSIDNILTYKVGESIKIRTKISNLKE